jgi:hypothetical protein
MRKLALALSLAILLVAAPARAASFTLSSLNVNLNQGGLALNWTSLLSGPLSFNVNNIGQTYTANLFTLSTKQSSLNLQSLIPHTINVGLGFTAPPPGFSGSSNGLTGAGWFLGNFGYVVWNNPSVMSFGTAGLLAVSLTNATFGLPGSATIAATFQLLQNSLTPPVIPTTPTQPPVQVPEPTSMLLVGLGGGVLAMLRARRARA